MDASLSLRPYSLCLLARCIRLDLLKSEQEFEQEAVLRIRVEMDARISLVNIRGLLCSQADT